MHALVARLRVALFPSFDDARVEREFRNAEASRTLAASSLAIALSIACTGLALLCETMLALAGDGTIVVALCRAVVILLTGLLPAAFLRSFGGRLDGTWINVLIVGVFATQTACLIGISAGVTTGGWGTPAISAYGPFRGWSSGLVIFHSALVHMSGLPLYVRRVPPRNDV